MHPPKLHQKFSGKRAQAFGSLWILPDYRSPTHPYPFREDSDVTHTHRHTRTAWKGVSQVSSETHTLSYSLALYLVCATGSILPQGTVENAAFKHLHATEHIQVSNSLSLSHSL